MLNRNKFLEMLQMQDDINKTIDENWVEVANPFLRAVVVECAEAMEHWGWKWWKHQEPNRKQAAMELVDIWHFYLSHLILENGGSLEDASDQILLTLEANRGVDFKFDGFLEGVEAMSNSATARCTNLAAFTYTMSQVNMSWDDLYLYYLGKNVLNRFRQNNGYKEGTYRKNWFGQEDNDSLVTALDGLDANDPECKDKLYSRLTAMYQEVIKDAEPLSQP